MHTYKDEKTGIVFHYNSDMSGWIDIVRPPGADGDGSQLSIPAEALSRFFFFGVCNGDSIIEMLDNFKSFIVGVRDLTNGVAKKAFEDVDPKGSA